MSEVLTGAKHLLEARHVGAVGVYNAVRRLSQENGAAHSNFPQDGGGF